MLTRRELLSTALAGSATFVAGASVARALTEQTMPPAVAAEYVRGCGGTNVAGHEQLMQTVRAALRGAIASGAKPASAEAIVACPLCGCRMTVTAGN